ncbi:MAG: hypothetical protein ACT4OK_07135 [Gemmobacter sp.]
MMSLQGANEVSAVASGPVPPEIAALAEAPTLRALKARIERLGVSADAKALLLDVAKLTVRVGAVVVAIGRKVLAVAFDLVARFQNVTFGIIIALLLSAVLGTIPLLGGVISALLTPLMLAFGIARGAMLDFRNASLQSEVDALSRKLDVLSAHATAA